MAKILLGVTGSVAATRTDLIVDQFRLSGHEVCIVATDASTYFFDITKYRESPLQLTLDADEWPGKQYQRGDAVRHIELRDWAEIFVIAPLDANTLAKFAVGLCDNALTCVWRAWDAQRPIVLAPAMNTQMWHHPMTKRHLRQLAYDAGAAHIPGHLDEAGLIAVLNERSPTMRVVAPITKELACGDIGVGAMAEVDAIVAVTNALLTI